MTVCVASPYPLTDLKGNSVTTRRVVEILNEGGMEARASHGYDGKPADVLISLHAVKGAQTVLDYKESHPEGKVVVLITGTDIYQSLPKGSDLGERALEQASAIVVVFERAIQSLAPRWRDKTVVIPASLDPIGVKAEPVCPPFAISVVGHLREVKRPFMAIEAVSRHPDWTDVEVWQLGEALNKEHAEQAREWEQRDSRYRWFGGLPRNESLALCAKSSLTVNSSILEGGANAVLEAMTMGVPVLASRIEGNLGLLGEGHGGYFDERMDEVLEQVMEDREIPATWARAAMERLPLFSRERESRCWLELLEKFS